jgi:type I restriction enzyme S subunit
MPGGMPVRPDLASGREFAPSANCDANATPKPTRETRALPKPTNPPPQFLPAGWKMVRLGDAVHASSEKVEPSEASKARYIGLEHIESGTKRLVGEGTAADVHSAKNVFRPGDVLYGRLRPYLNKVHRPEFNGICSTDILVLRCSEAITPRFLEYLVGLPGFISYAIINSAGINLPRVSFAKLADFAFSLPPLAEQRRIVARLETLMARSRRARAKLAEVPAQLAQACQSLLASAFRGDLTADWRHDNKAPKWRATIFGELISRIEAGQSFRCIEQPPKGNALGIVKVSAMSWGEFDEQESKTVIDADRLEPAHRICVGDLLMSRANTAELVGACVVVKKLTKRLFLSDKSLRLVVPEDWKLWCLYAFRSPDLVLQIANAASGNQHSMRNISQAAIRALQISLPDAEERDEIVRRLQAAFARLDAAAAAHAAAVAEMDRLDQALLTRAFSGQLVPQDSAEITPTALPSTLLPDSASTRQPIKAQPYLTQFIPALLRAVSDSLTLERLNAAVAFLFLPPDVFLPLVEKFNSPAARAHFANFNQPYKDGAFMGAINTLLRTQTLRPEIGPRDVLTLALASKLPPISSEIDADARHLAPIIPLIPRSAVKAVLPRLQLKEIHRTALELV